MDWVTDTQIWIGLATLVVLEIVLGIDNIVFLSILSSKLPPAQQPRARRIGLLVALVARVLLLLAISWMVRLTAPLFTVIGNEISGRDLILIAGGLFLIGKATHEIHAKLEEKPDGSLAMSRTTSFAGVIAQIVAVDVVFSIDSVVTAVGMVDELGVMIAAVVIAMIVMLVAAGPVAGFVDRHPTVKMLALSFLLLIGVALIADGLDEHIPRGYIYFAMAFSVFVELLNLRATKTRPPGAAKTRPPEAAKTRPPEAANP